MLALAGQHHRLHVGRQAVEERLDARARSCRRARCASAARARRRSASAPCRSACSEGGRSGNGRAAVGDMQAFPGGRREPLTLTRAAASPRRRIDRHRGWPVKPLRQPVRDPVHAAVHVPRRGRRGQYPRRRRGGDGGLHPSHPACRRPRDHPPAPQAAHPDPHDAGPDLRPDDRHGLRRQGWCSPGAAIRASARCTACATPIENGWPNPLAIEEHSHAAMANAYEAGAAGLPFAVFRGYIGADLPKVNPTIKTSPAPSPARSSRPCRRSGPMSRSSTR